MEVVLAALHQAQCQWEGKQPVPSSPWLSPCQGYLADKMSPEEDFNLLAAYWEGTHPTHTQHKQN